MKRNLIKLLTCSFLACVLASSPTTEFRVVAESEPIYETVVLQAPEEKITSELFEAMESEDVLIPVVCWYRAYSQNYIEGLIRDKIGFDINAVEETYAPPSQELLMALDRASKKVASNIVVSDSVSSSRTTAMIPSETFKYDRKTVDDYLNKLMHSHLEITSSAREIEKEKTELYKTARREIVSELYLQASSKLLTHMELDSK